MPDVIPAHHGVLLGGAAWTPPANCLLWLPFGYVLTAADQSGQGNDYATAGDANIDANGLNTGTTGYASRATITGTANATTLAMWVKTADVTVNAYIAEIGANGRAVIVGYQDGYINLYSTQYPTGVAAETQLAISAGEWVHVAWTITGSGASETLKGYRNGSPSYTVTGKWAQGVGMEYLGRYSGGFHFAGSINDVLRFSRVLSDADIADIYANSPGRPI